MDLPFWALNLKYPTYCEAEGPDVHPETCPLGLIVRLKFPARGNMGPGDFTWYDGNLIPREIEGERVPGSGVMFIGTEGMMFADYGSYRLFPAEKFTGFKAPEPTIPKSIGHHAEWIKACKEGTPTTCNFDYSGALSEAVLLGNVAFRAGKPLEWDAENLKATNCPEADQFIRKEYRAVVYGKPRFVSNRIEKRLTSDAKHPGRVCVTDSTHIGTRDAVSDYEVLETFDNFAYLRVEPRTGRKHQIRVHLASEELPILGDTFYRVGKFHHDLLPRHCLCPDRHLLNAY